MVIWYHQKIIRLKNLKWNRHALTFLCAQQGVFASPEQRVDTLDITGDLLLEQRPKTLTQLQQMVACYVVVLWFLQQQIPTSACTENLTLYIIVLSENKMFAFSIISWDGMAGILPHGKQFTKLLFSQHHGFRWPGDPVTQTAVVPVTDLAFQEYSGLGTRQINFQGNT